MSTITAEIAVTGSVGGRGVRAGCWPAWRRRRRRVSRRWRRSGRRCSFFVARDDEATLLLPRDGRVLEHGRPEAVLEAVAGVPARRRRICARSLTGCAVAPDAAQARQARRRLARRAGRRTATSICTAIRARQPGASSPPCIRVGRAGVARRVSRFQTAPRPRSAANGAPRRASTPDGFDLRLVALAGRDQHRRLA